LPNTESYTDLGNGTVLDNITCLTWQKTQNTPASTTFGVPSSSTLTDNQTYCAGLASSGYGGLTTWRIPTRIELASIVNLKATSGDAINPIFGKEAGGYYRTASDWYETITGQNASGFAWIYNMGSGLTSNAYAGTSAASVRCVAGNGTGEAIDVMAVEPPNHYTIANGEVTDNYTKLIWQQAFSPTTMDWSAAAGYCSSLGLNGHTWRTPSLNELATLVNEAKVSPAVNATAFPGVVSCGSTTWFWAAESATTTTDWGINYCDGYTGANTTTTGKWNYFTVGYVRCVR
jgi:hypothetical protein